MTVTAVISGNTTNDSRERMAEDMLAALLSRKAGLHVLMIPHLYHLPENDRRVKEELANLVGPVVFVSRLHPRPAEWLLRRQHVKCPLLTLDIRAFANPQACLDAFLNSEFARKHHRTPGGTGSVREVDADVKERWYPVIDYSRCANCKQCSQFCLFGVYELDEAGKVTVASPDNCKPGCPACSRICPRGAIMFPLCEDEAIAGAPGKLMSPDPSAKVMLYARTKRRCPICGSEYSAQPPEAGEKLCGECGRPIAKGKARPKASSDLDSLIDDLEQLR